jgi:hypothetical protein
MWPFVHPYVMRDIVVGPEHERNAGHFRDKNEGVFLGGDREWDGVILHEVDDMPIYSGVGNSGIDVAPVFLLGAEALGWGIKSRYSSREQLDDYQQVEGLGMIGKWGFKKLGYTIGDSAKRAFLAGSETATTNILGKQRGIVSGFFAAIAD